MRYLTALLAACLSVASFARDVPCLDPLACNFMEEGECFFTDENGDQCVVEGCTIEGACNYDPEADIYDGSCEFTSCIGCTDSDACNYDILAIYDNGLCEYPDAGYNCLGICLSDDDNDGVCNEFEIVGCTDPFADNFNPDATDSDDYCIYPCELNLEVVSIIPELCESSDGGIIINAEEAQFEVLFSLDSLLPFSSAASFYGLSAGMYTIHAIDGAGCLASVDVEVWGTPPIVVNVISQGDDINDSDTGFITVAAQAGMLPWDSFEYSWFGPNGFFSNENSISGLSAGYYTLEVHDVNGCISSFTFEIEAVYVDVIGCMDENAMNYDFDANVPSENCLYDCSEQNFGIGGELTDNQMTSFTQEIEFSGFEGSVLSDSLITSLYVNMEHSYMGDLTISFTCPTGQSLIVHQQGGGAANLGVPDQGDGTGPGTGWDYFWSPSATNGTWADNGGLYGQLPSDTYESVQPFTLLEGCPLDGTWSIEISDQWAADDGYLFSWGLVFHTCESECSDVEACNYDEEVEGNYYPCTYPENGFDCNGDCLTDSDGDGICDEFEVPGCSNPAACNYNLEATEDGACDFCFCLEGTEWNDSLQGCVVTEAALIQVCGEGTYWDDLAQACLTIETCQEDLDGDGVIGVEDLLQLLSSFGTECAPEPGGLEWNCGDPVTYHGYDYATVQIGEQCWFAENLRTELYANGDSIQGSLGDFEWSYGSEGAQAIYGEGTSAVYQGTDDEVFNLSSYGRLYNWNAVDDTRGLCPINWHVPLDFDFMILEQELGMDSAVVSMSGIRGTDQGIKLKSSPSDAPSWNGSNLSGFSGLAGGERQLYGGFFSEGTIAYFWSGTAIDNLAWGRALVDNVDGVGRYTHPIRNGFSVRCVQDSE